MLAQRTLALGILLSVFLSYYVIEVEICIA